MDDDRISVWQSTKTYTHGIGLTCCYRNYRAESHCNKLHGYSMQVNFTFETVALDVRNFVVDFGGLKNLKELLENMLDHKCLVAEDDPHFSEFERLNGLGIIDMVILPHLSCERFAEFIYEVTEQWLIDAGFGPRCSLVQVELREHESNSAVFFKRDLPKNGQ